MRYQRLGIKEISEKESTSRFWVGAFREMPLQVFCFLEIS